ncbi:RraA family protein [Peribacillus saganii]|uniref:Putative 4-hydroxy-4-methyl-2-oxoglutarate aldolase n=2 Tax=Peribacillus saganii TaxID=2303992 RepID=A0A372LR56_9BACI|nr:RraA family protein [Peribacillus saganii]
MVGPAFTVKYVPIGEHKGTVGDYIDDCKAGDVIVLNNAGRTTCPVWGDILTYVATAKGITGTVIDGVCRDVDGSRELGYPMLSRWHNMVTGKDRVMVQSVNETVAISDIQVRPGDLIVGDESGVLVIPRNRADEVLAFAKEIDATERLIFNKVKNGVHGERLAKSTVTMNYKEAMSKAIKKNPQLFNEQLGILLHLSQN